ncbi:MAG: OsmC family protein [Planctomycetota bacterium]|nr:OsmC family protein [Planctomycetota bacterium]
MREIKARTDGAMRVEATDGTVTTFMDEPASLGGGGTAPTPVQTLMASLAGCTVITLKMYSARKEWPLEDVDVRVTLEDGEKGAPNRWTQHVTLKGDLDEDQRERLMQIAGRCPVHRILEGENVFEEVETEPAGAE